MKFCMPHWDALRAAIDHRGLTSLIAESGEKAAANIASELDAGPTLDNFDPLMAAHFAIINNAMEAAGGAAIEMMTPKPDGGEWCPLCFVNEKNPYGYNYDEWIDLAAGDQVDAWKALHP